MSRGRSGVFWLWYFKLIQAQAHFMSASTFKRVLLKLSGEALMGDSGYGIDTETVTRIGRDIKDVVDYGVEV